MLVRESEREKQSREKKRVRERRERRGEGWNEGHENSVGNISLPLFSHSMPQPIPTGCFMRVRKIKLVSQLDNQPP